MLVNHAAADLEQVSEPFKSQIKYEVFRLIKQTPFVGPALDGESHRYFLRSPFVILYDVDEDYNVTVQRIVREDCPW